jgi:ribosomal protein S18 acetylase RimI-like enzyme
MKKNLTAQGWCEAYLSKSCSPTIFNPNDRRRGYGTKALELLLDLFQKNDAAEKVYAKVSKTNVTSLCFFRKLGFEVSRRYEDSFILERDQT